MVMDIDHIASAQVDVNNDNQKWLTFNQNQGARQSINENLVPEQFFNDSNSTKKCRWNKCSQSLKLANDQGQKIYQINQSNANTILPQLNHDSQVITDIRNAVASGKIVTTSEKSISFNGWKGSGYIIIDPSTGSGAYMISGV
jgi:lipase chaperone LimK